LAKQKDNLIFGNSPPPSVTSGSATDRHGGYLAFWEWIRWLD